MSTEQQERLRQIAERLNSIRQDWEIDISRAYPPASLHEVNMLAGVLAELLHTLAYDSEKGGTAGIADPS